MTATEANRTEITPGGAVITSRCIAQQAADGAAWSVWRSSCGGTLRTWIEMTDNLGRITLEGHFPRVDCPLEFLSMTRPVNWAWRDHCWAFHEGKIE